MIIEYKKSTVGGIGYDLCISSDAYKRANTEEGWNDHNAMMFAVRAYCNCYKSHDLENIIGGQDIEEAYRHIKNKGTILITAKKDFYGNAWCEIYTVTDGGIIPVKTKDSNGNIVINYSAKTQREMTKRGKNNE